MSVAKSKVHHCVGQIKIAENKTEPPAPRCRCRKLVSLTEATKMVKNGEASWVVLTRTRVTREQSCRLCKGDPEFKLCANCKGTGTELLPFDEEEYANDIVLVSRPPADQREKKQSSALAAKTPRTATIEEEHILRAYVSDQARELVAEAERGGKTTKKYLNDQTSPQTAQAIRDRIEEYGRMVTDSLRYVGKARIPMITLEPADDPRTGTGRRYDYGRTI